MDKFIEKLVDVLDLEDEIAMDTVLEDLDEWDSLSVVSFIAMANTSYGKKISATDVRKAVTVNDLYEMVK